MLDPGDGVDHVRLAEARLDRNDLRLGRDSHEPVTLLGAGSGPAVPRRDPGHMGSVAVGVAFPRASRVDLRPRPLRPVVVAGRMRSRIIGLVPHPAHARVPGGIAEVAVGEVDPGVDDAHHHALPGRPGGWVGGRSAPMRLRGPHLRAAHVQEGPKRKREIHPAHARHPRQLLHPGNGDGSGHHLARHRAQGETGRTQRAGVGGGDEEVEPRVGARALSRGLGKAHDAGSDRGGRSGKRSRSRFLQFACRRSCLRLAGEIEGQPHPGREYGRRGSRARGPGGRSNGRVRERVPRRRGHGEDGGQEDGRQEEDEAADHAGILLRSRSRDRGGNVRGRIAALGGGRSLSHGS